MKRLLLMRHAKSDRSADYGEDHERPLNKRGEASAQAIGRFLTLTKQQPDVGLTSSAVRARRTLELAIAAGGWNCPIRPTRTLYEGGPADILDEINQENDDTSALIVVGHEPTWSVLAGGLVGGGALGMVTGALAAIDFDVESWDAARPGRGVLAWMLVPRLLTEGELDLG